MEKGNRKEKSAMAASGLSEAKFKFLWDRLDTKVKKNCSGVAIGAIMKIAYEYGHLDGYNAGIFMETDDSVFQKLKGVSKDMWHKRKTYTACIKNRMALAMKKVKAVFNQ